MTGSVEVSNLPAPGGACTPFQLVGFTTATLAGNQGVLAFGRACQQDFPGSWMCSSVEVLETTAIPSDLTGPAWVRPTYVAGGSPVGHDASGVTHFDAA